MRILKLKLRGAIGIKKGLGVDEVEIDFTQFQPGLIALTGRNGSGKTTIMENLHPYRCMVSRDGSLQNHFFLKDSYRIIDFEIAGKFYKAQINIDALTGGSEAYLFESRIDTRTGELEYDHALNDGKLTTYDQALEKLLGTPELFFNSVFSGQKSKGIAELKPADRRKLFYELLNLNSYETYLEHAKSKLKAEELRLAEVEGEIRAIGENTDFSIEMHEEQLTVVRLKIKELQNEIEKNEHAIEQINEEIKQNEIEIQIGNESLKSNDEYKKTIATLFENLNAVTKDSNSKLARYESDLQDYYKIITNNGFLIKKKEEIETGLRLMDGIEELISTLQEKRNVLLEKKSAIQKGYSEAHQGLQKRERELHDKSKNLELLKQNLRTAQKDLNRVKEDAELISTVPCGTETGSKCRFLSNAFASEKNIEFFESEVKRISSEIKLLEINYNDLGSSINSQKELIEERCQIALKEVAEYTSIESELSKEKTLLADYKNRKYKEQLDQLLKAENEITLYQQKIDSTNKLIDELKASSSKEIYRITDEIEELQKKIDYDLAEKIAKKHEQISILQLRRQNLKHNLDARKTELENKRNEVARIIQLIEDLKKDLEKLEILKGKKLCIEDQIKDWAFLCKAFDKTGIPVLKLENSGVEITTIANELLSLFENKFRIVFETTSLTKDKKKLKETFDINIVEEDGVCEIGNKSGGQQVWLETAIQLAISLVVRQQGRNIQTSFLDEKDGALDLDNAYSYIEMLKKAHQMSGVYNTFIITHRTELLDFIPQQVKLSDGYLQILN
jgi:exonuclease SbcC